MKQNQKFILCIMLAAFCLYASSGHVYSSGSKEDGQKVVTPLPGNPIRKAILDTPRQEIKRLPGINVENPKCLNGPEYFVGLQERFPGIEEIY